MFISHTKITVRYAETDQMGIAHHSNYFIWFEVGRDDFLRHIGTYYSKVEENGMMLPLIDAKCTYKSPARYFEDLYVNTYIKEMTAIRIVFGYSVEKSDSKIILAEGETVHVWVNKKFKPVSLKKHLPDVYNVLESAAK